jgi:hypothetical protein
MNRRRGKPRNGAWFSSFSLALCFISALFSFIFVSVSVGGEYTYTQLQPTGWDYGGTVNSCG